MRQLWLAALGAFLLAAAQAHGAVGDGVSAASAAQMHPPVQRVIVVLVNGLSLDDVATHPRWQVLAAEGWLAGMTLKTARGHGDVHQAVTLGAGAYAAGHKEVHGFDANERLETGWTAADEYAQLTGRRRQEGVVVPAVGQLVRENEKTGRFPATPGALGQRIRDAGGWTAVFGNSDRGATVKRLAPLVTMDESGWTPLGEVGPGMVRRDRERPFGVATNYGRMLTQFRQLPAGVRLAVFELGDLDRWEAVRDKMADGHARHLRQQILTEMADFVSSLKQALLPHDALFVVSLMVDEESYRNGMWLAPVLWLSHSSAGGGLLYSPSTRRAGIVTNLDVTATILDQLGLGSDRRMGGLPLQLAESVGNSAVSEEESAFWDELARMQWAHQLRPKVLRPYVIQQMVLLLLAAVVWLLRLRRWYRPIRVLLLAMLFAPAVLLVISDPRASAGHVLLLVWAVPILAAWVTERWSWRLALLTASVSAWATIALDLWRGGIWLKRSLLSYDPMLAARFYGIGNEFMGIVVGAVILTAALLWGWFRPLEQQWKARWVRCGVSLGMLAWLAVLAAPQAGANAGGALTAGVGFVGTWFFLRFSHISPGRIALYSLIGFLVAVVLLFVFNGGWLEEPVQHESSHVGQALAAAGDGEWELLQSLVLRKLETNWRLIRHSIWTKVVATALIVSFCVQFVPRNGERTWRLRSEWSAAFRGILAASVTALLFNDSGIVAAATAIVYLVVPMLLLRLAPSGDHLC